MLRAAFLLVGLALFALLALRLGPGAIAAAVSRMGWSAAAVGAIFLVYQLARALALRLCLLANDPVDLRQALWIRLSGEAVQLLTFTGPFLAEPTKAWLLRHRGATTRQAFAAVVAEYLLYTFLSAALSIVALVLLTTRFDLAPALLRTARVLILLMAAFLGVSLVAIVGRIYLIGAIIGGLTRLPGLRGRLKPDRHAVRDMEDLLLEVLRERPGRLAAILLVEAIAQALLVTELIVLLRALHPEAPWWYAFLVEAGAKFTSLAFFFIPTQLGATEATYAVLLGALALPPPSGFALALVRRLRSLAVAAIGLAALWKLVPTRRERRQRSADDT